MKGNQFNSWRTVGVAMQSSAIYGARGVDELIILDVDASPAGAPPDLAEIARLTEHVFTPLTVGGGIRTIAQIEKLLRHGADKVAISTALIEDPTLLPRAVARFGSQAIVAAIDHAANHVTRCCGKYLTHINVLDWALECEAKGAGEIMLTSVERDGQMCGYDLETIEKVAKATRVPVIAAGGAGSYEHMHQAIQAGASACAAGALYLFTEATPRGAARYLANKGIEVRI